MCTHMHIYLPSYLATYMHAYIHIHIHIYGRSFTNCALGPVVVTTRPCKLTLLGCVARAFFL